MVGCSNLTADRAKGAIIKGDGKHSRRRGKGGFPFRQGKHRRCLCVGDEARIPPIGIGANGYFDYSAIT